MARGPDLLKLLVIFNVALHSSTGYRRNVIRHEINDDFACNNQTCDGRPHSSCPLPQVSVPLLLSVVRRVHIFIYSLILAQHKKNCENLNLKRVVKLTRGDIRMLLLGHNGLRNRVALTLNPPVSNMNLLHWDENLQQMAEGWIKQCTINTDACEFIRTS